ncbi:MAG: acylphosphatase [Dehalococcoidia bacterium]
MPDRARLTATVYGRVQGVFYRAFVYDYAISRSIVGYVRNLPSGTAVEVTAEGESGPLEEFLGLLKIGPPSARVDRVDLHWGTPTGEFASFQIVG